MSLVAPIHAPTSAVMPAPECHGRPMTPVTSRVTLRTFYRCDACLKNTYNDTRSTP